MRVGAGLIAAPAVIRPARAWLHPGASGQGQLAFNYIKDSTWTSNPNVSQYEAVLAGVVSWLNTNFAFASCTIDLALYVFNTTSIGSSFNTYFAYSGITDYAGTKSFLLGLPKDNLKNTAYATLPASDPSPNTNYIVTSAHYTSCTGGTLHNALQENGVHFMADGLNGISLDYTVNGSTCAAGKASLFYLMVHEITEVLGRISGLFAVSPFKTSSLDLFTFTANNTRSFSGTATGRYYSIDSGATNTGFDTNGDGAGHTPFYCLSNAGDAGGWGATYLSPYQEQTPTLGTPGIPLRGDVLLTAALWPTTAAGRAYAGI